MDREEIKRHLQQMDLSSYTALPANNVNARFVCFFDEEQRFRRLPIKQAYGKVKGVEKHKGYYRLSGAVDASKINHNYWTRVMGRMQEGDSYEAFLEMCETVREELGSSMSWLERFIAKTDKPYFERKPGNNDAGSFDYVRLYMFLSDMGMDTRETVKENFRDIVDVALERIESYTGYKQYNVPVSCLHLKSAKLTKQKALILLFEKEREDND